MASLTEFWQCFNEKDFLSAQEKLDQLNSEDKQGVLAELFQKSEYHRTPDIVSVLYRKLDDEKTFDDFYQA